MPAIAIMAQILATKNSWTTTWARRMAPGSRAPSSSRLANFMTFANGSSRACSSARGIIQ